MSRDWELFQVQFFELSYDDHLRSSIEQSHKDESDVDGDSGFIKENNHVLISNR